MTKYVQWEEPMFGKDGEILGCEIHRALPEDCIKYWKHWHPYPYTDEKALDDFMVVNWAYFKEYNDN